MKLWIDAKVAPPSVGWTWCKTSQEAMPAIQGNLVEQISIFLNLGPESTLSGIALLRQIYLGAQKGTLNPIRLALRGADVWAEAQKAPIIIGEANKEWARRAKRAKAQQ